MPDCPELEELEKHVVDCGICSRANKRVNDFCDRGRFLFAEFTKTAQGKPRRVTLLGVEESRKIIEQENARARKREQN